MDHTVGLHVFYGKKKKKRNWNWRLCTILLTGKMLKMEGLYKKIEIIRECSIPPPSPPPPNTRHARLEGISFE